jgi:hypothetical protein
MTVKEKGRPAGGDPIPNCVVIHDAAEIKASPHFLQVSLLTRRCALSAALAEALAPLAFGATS